MRKLTAFTCIGMAISSCTCNQGNKYIPKNQGIGVSDYKHNLALGVEIWSIGNSTVTYAGNDLDPSIVVNGEAYLEIEPKQPIEINTVGNKDISILPQRVERSIYVCNKINEKEAQVTVVEGIAGVLINDVIYTLHREETLHVSASNEITITHDRPILDKLKTIRIKRIAKNLLLQPNYLLNILK